MSVFASLLAIALVSFAVAPRCRASSFDDNPETSHQLSLADLAGYRAALSGKPTADSARASDPPVETKFKDLWNRPDDFRGRRVSIQGHVARIFRQAPVGSFPALAEVWITSPVGDPFCVVFPQPGPTGFDDHLERQSDGGRGIAVPELGQMVRFTGTFLKMVRYAGGDGPRLAPLIVGGQQPMPVVLKPGVGHSAEEIGSLGNGSDRHGSDRHSGAALRPAYWALGLAMLAVGAVILARWHLRKPVHPAAGRKQSVRSIPDPPLEFIEPRDQP
jgi:hypothetical protein